METLDLVQYEIDFNNREFTVNMTEGNQLIAQYKARNMDICNVAQLLTDEEMKKIDINLDIYSGYILSNEPRNGIGTNLWMYAEQELYKRKDRSYYRLVSDGTENGWAKRTLPKVLNYLRDSNIAVSIVSSDDIYELTYWLLLFEK